MFVQLIEGRVTDQAMFRRLAERWETELRPGATGFLGSTGGVAEDGRAIIAARFESAEAAQTNSDRSEQGQWWAEMEKCFDGEVRFTDSADTDLFVGGDLDSAGFVQVMKNAGVDRDKLRGLDAAFEKVAADWRPDVLGGYRVWTAPDAYVELMYFTNEAEAREGEQKEPPAELAASMADFESIMATMEFIDLPEPYIR